MTIIKDHIRNKLKFFGVKTSVNGLVIHRKSNRIWTECISIVKASRISRLTEMSHLLVINRLIIYLKLISGEILIAKYT